MSHEQSRHCDCRNYAPVDVVKGICHRTKDLILGDEQHCQHFAALAKCVNCSHYSTADEEFMGTCNAEAEKPWTYPDLIALNCEMYKTASR